MGRPGLGDHSTQVAGRGVVESTTHLPVIQTCICTVITTLHLTQSPISRVSTPPGEQGGFPSIVLGHVVLRALAPF